MRNDILIRIDAVVREAVDVPKTGFEECTNEVCEAIVYILETNLWIHFPRGMASTYKARKANASSVSFKLQLLRKAGELTAQPPL
jgi:hypothetical protein